jgi:hypothetical protein
MSKFPFLESIRDGSMPRVFGGMEQGVIDWSAISSSTLGFGVLFDVSVASDLYWMGKQDDYHLDHDFGPLRSPFPAMWMEWRIPKAPLVFGNPAPDSPFAGRRMAALISESTEYTAVEIGEQAAAYRRSSGTSEFMSRVTSIPSRSVGLTICQLIEGDSGAPEEIPMGVNLLVDAETGRYVSGSKHDLPTNEVAAELGRNNPLAQLIRAIDQNVPLLALNLINCKNVALADGGQAVKRTTREKRIGIPPLRYKTIQLPGTRGEGGARTRAENMDAMALHRVRGHFKTFTADAPLMGQHVGTYWWGWQVRGKKENGIVVSDYKVGASA